MASVPRKTTPTATSASANASGNQRSNHSDRRRPRAASHEPLDCSRAIIGGDHINPVIGPSAVSGQDVLCYAPDPMRPLPFLLLFLGLVSSTDPAAAQGLADRPD